MTHGHRQQCDDGQRRGEQGLGGGGQSGGNGDSCNSVNNKLKKEKGNWSITIQSGNSDSFPV